MAEEDKKTSLEKLEAAVSNFWKKENKSGIIKGKNAQFVIEPKVFINNALNPSVGKSIIKAYLKKISKEDVMKKYVTISPKQIIIYAKDGTPLVELQGDIIDKMVNPLTNYIGKALVNAPDKEEYSFSEIKDALIEFISEKDLGNKNNPLQEALKLL
jgi:hypothetical protein